MHNSSINPYLYLNSYYIKYRTIIIYRYFILKEKEFDGSHPPPTTPMRVDDGNFTF
jgi:hypothetical protein